MRIHCPLGRFEFVTRRITVKKKWHFPSRLSACKVIQRFRVEPKNTDAKRIATTMSRIV